MFDTVTLRDGRTLEYADLGDPAGRPVLFLPGTPATAGQGLVVAEGASVNGVRVIAVSRPGYGDSTNTPPGLISAAADALELADQLGLGRFATLGISGGGPFSLALGALGAERVTSVTLHAGTGPYFEVMAPTEEDAGDRRAMAMYEAGDVDGAIGAMVASADGDFGPLRELSDAAFEEALGAMVPPGETWLQRHPDAAVVFSADFRRAVQTSAGCVRDLLSWGGAWDVDLSAVRQPVRLVTGESDRMVPPPHSEWLLERLPHAELVVVPGGHGDVSFGQAGETFSALAADAHIP